MADHVAVLGGGVAGLSAAHELIERGFAVTVYEKRPRAGGKARSLDVPGAPAPGNRPLPGEHGFRFFPGFYKHINDTMKRIPLPGVPGGTVFDNLVPTHEVLVAREGKSDPAYLAGLPTSLAGLVKALKTLFGSDLGIPLSEWLFFAGRVLYVMTSSEERRFGELENVSWWDFVRASDMTLAYRRYLATGLTRSLVAMKAEKGSARTIGVILVQLLQDLGDPNVTLDRVLDGPTNEVWIDPWRTHLEGQGVTVHTEATLTGFHLAGGRVASVDVEIGGVAQSVVADHYVCAIPVERLVPLLTPDMIALDPRLGELHLLETEWMNGIQYYLKDDVPLARGHTIFIDSPWALTSISQAQFWEARLSGYGEGNVRGILSVDISDWNQPGVIFGKPARELSSADEIHREVWEQMKRAVNDDAVMDLMDQNLVTWFLDPAIEFPNPSTVSNLEPLLINTKGSWAHRPEAITAIENLFLASDFVRTFTDLATMEAANEAARRAVNGILDRTGSSAPRAEVMPLHEPAILAPLRRLDARRYAAGRPHWIRPAP
ncbi:MAG: FAD-dependent oxidoreductase [Myxococcota bacterium]|nr:FAD-dependent oxidoreductase [Myxococcota bacterium]